MADKKKKITHTQSKKPATVMEKAKKQAEQMQVSTAKTKKDGKKKGNAVIKYFRDMRSELKKVVWPSRKKVVNNTAVVMVCMVAYGLVIWGIDSGFAALFSLLVKTPAA
jgi:preprotein translocase subunit SecE